MDIKVSNLSKKYDDLQVFLDYKETFGEYETTCIMGPSGCGKTTLMRILLGLEKADTGVISGIDRDSVSAVFQEDCLCEHLSVEMNIRLAHQEELTKQELDYHLQMVELETVSTKIVKELSGGMKRRVAIVRAVIGKNQLVIMDEPFKGLDEQLKEKVIDYVREECQKKTLIIVTHDQLAVEYLQPNRVIKMG